MSDAREGGYSEEQDLPSSSHHSNITMRETRRYCTTSSPDVSQIHSAPVAEDPSSCPLHPGRLHRTCCQFPHLPSGGRSRPPWLCGLDQEMANSMDNSFFLCRMGITEPTGHVWGSNELMQVKHLAQCLAASRGLINDGTVFSTCIFSFR